ncbi:SIS domain-containing protein [Nocardia sp. NPDC004722]
MASYDRMAVVGRGACFPAVMETVLELQETTGVVAAAFSTADFRHGPIAMTGPQAPVVLLAGSGPSDTLALRPLLAERSAPIIVAGSAVDADISWPAPNCRGECLLATVRGQQPALALARARGIDPDHPAGLNKVTLTH